MNELLQKHGCSNVFTVPEGLRELMADITREVLRDQPPKIFDYIANYLSVLLITREHGILAVKILDDLCDCRPSVSEHLIQHGIERDQAETLSQIIKEEVEGIEPLEGKEKVKETQILKKILTRTVLDEDMAAKVCQVARNAYRDYWYRKKLIEKNLKVHPNEPWEIAAERTLDLYKRTKPSFTELNRATEKIQAAYRGYHVRRNTLRHLKPKTKKKGPKVELPGPPIDVAGSREIDLGPIIDLRVREVDTTPMFDEMVGEKLGLQYNPMKTLTLVEDAAIEEPKMGNFPEPRHSKFNERSTTFQEPRPTKFEAPRSSKFEEPLPTKLESHAGGLSSKSVTQPVVEKSALKQASLETAPVIEEKIPEQRQIRISSVVDDVSRPARSVHSATQESSLYKISFAEKPVEFEIPSEIPEEIIIAKPEKPEEVKVSDLPEVPEAIEPKPDKADDPEDDAQEVTEDIPDDRTEGDDSAPTASIPSSAPDTANSSEVEDAGDTGEEDGE